MSLLEEKLEGRISRTGARVGVSGRGRLSCCFGFHYRLHHPERGGARSRGHVRSTRDGRSAGRVRALRAYLTGQGCAVRNKEGIDASEVNIVRIPLAQNASDMNLPEWQISK